MDIFFGLLPSQKKDGFGNNLDPNDTFIVATLMHHLSNTWTHPTGRLPVLENRYFLSILHPLCPLFAAFWKCCISATHPICPTSTLPLAHPLCPSIFSFHASFLLVLSFLSFFSFLLIHSCLGSSLSVCFSLLVFSFLFQVSIKLSDLSCLFGYGVFISSTSISISPMSSISPPLW